MKGFAYPDAELIEILPSDLSSYDKHFWLISTRGGWHPSCANPSSLDYEDLDEELGRSFIQETHCKGYRAVVDLGRFSTIAACIGLDEWTYLVAIPCDHQMLKSVLSDDRLTHFLSADFFEALAHYSATLITYIDGWWECFPDSSSLLGEFGIDLQRSETTSQKWADYSQDYTSRIYPNFENANKTLHPTAGNAPLLNRASSPAVDELDVR